MFIIYERRETVFFLGLTQRGKFPYRVWNQMQTCSETWANRVPGPVLPLGGVWSLKFLPWTFLISPLILESQNRQCHPDGTPWPRTRTHGAPSSLLGIFPSSAVLWGWPDAPGDLSLMFVMSSWNQGPFGGGLLRERRVLVAWLVFLSWDHKELGHQLC